MFVKVRYHKPALGAYAGAEYLYRTELPLVIGDRVIAPTAKEPLTRAIVTAVNAEEPPFVCRVITDYDLNAEIVSVD